MSSQPSQRLSPGDVLADSYLIQRFLGSGAVGHVYQAHHLLLDESVALKVPRPSHPRYASLKDQLFDEVAKAKKVTHPNVCRVHEVAVDPERDLVFLSMELLQGGTLEELLVDPQADLSRETRLRMVHELCGGVAAIHAKNLIHRDLKTTNVMTDAAGRVRIVDFGLAAWTEQLIDPAEGTFLYKAPEQFEGGQITRQADLFSLGLILYQIFLGELPKVGGKDPETLEGIREQRNRIRTELDRWIAAGRARQRRGHKLPLEPPLAQEIRQYLEEDPENRPGSAEEIVQVLPKPPLIPTRVERLLREPRRRWSPRAASAALVATLLGLVLVAWLSQWTQPSQAATRGLPPSGLEERAREILTKLGSNDTPKDWSAGFVSSSDPGDPDTPLRFWYRQSPERLPRWRKGSAFHRYEDPPFDTPGEVGIHLDPQGRLRRLDAVPRDPGEATKRESPGPVGAFDWGRLWEATGLEARDFQLAASTWIPPVYADRRRAWVPRAGGQGLRLEAAAFEGRLTAFRVLDTDREATRETSSARLLPNAEETRRGTSPLGTLVHCLGIGVLLVGGVWLARRRLREHLADRPAAFRLALFVFGARVLVGLLGSPHRWSPLELDLAIQVFARSLYGAAVAWLIYIAVEPWVRYYSPDLVASWVRLMYGRRHDSLVGRDLLVGGLFGVAVLLWARLYAIVPGWLGLPAPRPGELGTLALLLGQDQMALHAEALSSFPRTLGMVAYAAVHGVLLALVLVAVLVLLRWLLEGTRLPGAVWISRFIGFGLYTIMLYPGAGHPALDLLAATGTAVLGFVVLFRFGFLAATTAMVFAWVLSCHPLIVDPTSWAFPGALVPMLVTGGIALWGFRVTWKAAATPSWA